MFMNERSKDNKFPISIISENKHLKIRKRLIKEIGTRSKIHYSKIKTMKK